MQTHFYEGILYKVEYKPHLSNRNYTQHLVYYIETEQESWTKARKAIESIMEDVHGYKPWTSGYYTFKNEKEPNMYNALHSYYKFSFDEDKQVFIYTLVIPYDD